jgi:hypothetical protein
MPDHRSPVRVSLCHGWVPADQTTGTGRQSGDTGHSGVPHLHIELHYNNVRYWPQPVMQTLYNGQTGPFTLDRPRLLHLTRARRPRERWECGRRRPPTANSASAAHAQSGVPSTRRFWTRPTI